MKTKNRLLTDEQLALIEFAVEFLYNKQTKKDSMYNMALTTAIERSYAYRKAMEKWPNGSIGLAELKFLLGKHAAYPIKLDDVIAYKNKKYISIEEAKKKIEAHYMRPKVWRPADTMPSAIGQTPIIYAIVSNDKIARIDMSVFDLPDSSPAVLWQFVCKFYKIRFWAYPQDILPREDDERGTTDAAL